MFLLKFADILEILRLDIKTRINQLTETNEFDFIKDLINNWDDPKEKESLEQALESNDYDTLWDYGLKEMLTTVQYVGENNYVSEAILLSVTKENGVSIFCMESETDLNIKYNELLNLENQITLIEAMESYLEDNE